MALPKLETPKYEMEIPSTKEVVEYRPFLVKEEKLLMIAQETNDSKEIIRVMRDIIEACTFNKVKANNLTVYDAEYIFLQLRSKSVGENVDFQLKCSECNTPNRVTLHLGDVGVYSPPNMELVSNKVELTDKVGMTLKPVSMKNAATVDNQSEDMITNLLISVIENIYDEDNVYPADNTSTEELVEFVESLNHEQVTQIQKYISSLPSLQHTIVFNCINCKTKNEQVLNGLQDFFV